MYLSHMLTRHQKACSDGMFISSMAARGAYLTKKCFQNVIYIGFKYFYMEFKNMSIKVTCA